MTIKVWSLLRWSVVWKCCTNFLCLHHQRSVWWVTNLLAVVHSPSGPCSERVPLSESNYAYKKEGPTCHHWWWSRDSHQHGYQLHFCMGNHLRRLHCITEVFHTCKFFFLWNTMLFALTFLSFMSTLFPQRTMGMFSHTRTRSRCQFGTFLYVTRDVTSNIIMAHCPWNIMNNETTCHKKSSCVKARSGFLIFHVV
jgi:hypothetical protein